jgi:hypothetical protein
MRMYLLTWAQQEYGTSSYSSEYDFYKYDIVLYQAIESFKKDILSCSEKDVSGP